MAVSNVESLLTAFERNYEQIKLTGYGRFTNVETHNKTYNGVLNSIRTIESEKKDDIIIEIFKRGQDMVSPVKIYSSKDNDEKCASEILVEERERDKELNKKERSQRLKTLLETLEPKDEFEKKQVIKLKEELCFLL